MKIMVLVLAVITLAWSVHCEETSYSVVRLTPTNDPSITTGTGDLTLTGTKLIFQIDTAGCPRIASFHGPGSSGSVGPTMFQIAGGDCSADTSNGFAGETNLSAADSRCRRRL